MQTNPSNWPPAYKLRLSQRARYVSLKYCHVNGLEIIAPKKFNPQSAKQILEKHRHWIERTLQKFNAIETNTEEKVTLPATINVAALNQIWEVSYESTAASVLHLKQIEQNKLLITGNIQNQSTVKKSLRNWLKRLSKNHLISQLHHLSQLHNLPFTKAGIRHSLTHWGSCNAKKNISLSTQLMLVPPALVEYVLLHELCHTKFLNHSKSFWQLLESVNPNCHKLRKQLRVAQHSLPHWIIEK